MKHKVAQLIGFQHVFPHILFYSFEDVNILLRQLNFQFAVLTYLRSEGVWNECEMEQNPLPALILSGPSVVDGRRHYPQGVLFELGSFAEAVGRCASSLDHGIELPVQALGGDFVGYKITGNVAGARISEHVRE